MCDITGRLSAYAGYTHVNAWHPFVFLTVLQNTKLRESGGHRSVATLLCALKPKCVSCLSVSPAKRKCLIMDTDQPVTDTSFYNQIQIYLFITHHTTGYPVLLQLF